jgi:hypothetical protein
MKKLYPEAADVTQSVANRAARIVEKHLRTQRVSRACDLPEEARIRLYRDLRLFFEGGSQASGTDSGKRRLSVRETISLLWEKLEDFLSASQVDTAIQPAALFGAFN